MDRADEALLSCICRAVRPVLLRFIVWSFLVVQHFAGHAVFFVLRLDAAFLKGHIDSLS
jgi:hypothetical protein